MYLSLNAQSQGQCCRARWSWPVWWQTWTQPYTEGRPFGPWHYAGRRLITSAFFMHIKHDEGQDTLLLHFCLTNLCGVTSKRETKSSRSHACLPVCVRVCCFAHKKRHCVTRSIFQCHYIVNANLQRLTCRSIYNDALHIIVQQNNTWLSRQLFVMRLFHVVLSSLACPLRHAAERQRQPPACLLKLITFRVDVKPFSKCFCESNWFLPWNAELAKELGMD